MAGSYTQIYIQVVFAVKYRQALISSAWKDELHRYLAGIVQAHNHKSIIVNGVADHVHLFIGMRPAEDLSSLVREVKNCSTNFINKNHLSRGRFAWQEGYGAFSYSHSNIQNVYQYILKQEEHHRIKTFKEEYTALLKEHSINYDEKYLFDWEMAY